MPVVVDPDPMVVETLLASMPAGAHGVESVDRLNAWLSAHSDEYVVVLGPTLTDEESVVTCEVLRTTAPAISTILAREHLDGELLAAAMKSGARDVVHHTDSNAIAASIGRAFELYVALRGPAGSMHMSKVIAVFSPKGGVGKTTISVNLALALTEKGARRVCLVDLDLAFGDVAITMQLFPTHSIEQAIGSEDAIDVELLDALLTRHQDSLMVLAAPPHPDTRERVTPLLVSRIIRTLRETFDYIVIDMAPAFDEQMLTALDETDEIVLVTTLDVPTLKNVKVAVETFDALHIARDNRHLVLNRADDEVGITADKVEGILGMTVEAQISSSLDIAAATNAGSPVIVSDPEHQLSGSIRQLAATLAGEHVGSVSVPESTIPQSEAEAKSRRSRRRK
jgi:pilus assembly protein CpaE